MNAHWTPVYIGVGSNISEPRVQVLKAVETLRALAPEHLRVIAVSVGTRAHALVARGVKSCVLGRKRERAVD